LKQKRDKKIEKEEITL